ncbi:MAG: hypothetical protein J7L38_00585 [Thermoproteales archaeon]|nr:hypothetical protein [Thermoproteales archaeon]
MPINPNNAMRVPKGLWLLIFLALNKYEPVEGYARLQFIFFIYDLIGFTYTVNAYGPYSRELERALLSLQEQGLVKVVKEGVKRKYILTEEGKKQAYELILKIKDKYIQVAGALIIRGEEIIRELKKIKYSYRDKPLLYLFYKCQRKILERVSPYGGDELKPLMRIFMGELERDVEKAAKKL